MTTNKLYISYLTQLKVIKHQNTSPNHSSYVAVAGFLGARYTWKLVRGGGGLGPALVIL